MATSLNRTEDRRGDRRDDLLISAVLVAIAIMLLGNCAALYAMHDSSTPLRFYSAYNLTLVAFVLNHALLFIGWRRYRDMRGKVSGLVSAERRTKKLAVSDPLTGFYNRRAIVELTADLISKAEAKGQAVAFLLLDVDDFKQVNDLYGHPAGDFLLCQFAERVQKVAPARAYLSRIGGDEFAFVFAFSPELPREVTRFAEAIIEETQRPFVKENLFLDLTVSIGIARHDHNGSSVDELMRRADIAMYEAKRSGKNNKCWFSANMESELQSRSEIEGAIRRGIPASEFVPYFEPQVDISTGRITGFEMLARWNSRDHAHVSTEKFIRIAQEAGLINTLSISIMEQAFSEARSWDPSLTLSVNISPIQLLDERLAQQMLKLLVATGFPPQRLEVEITEGAIFKNVDLAKTIIHSLKNQGIRIAYDDFGTGYSSLTHLRELPFDRIKIDRTFVSAAAMDKDSAEMVRAITSLCASLGLPITAEGIENEDVHDFMAKLGDFIGQGYYYGRPMSLVDVRKLLSEKDLLPPNRDPNDNPFFESSPVPGYRGQWKKDSAAG